jgi:siroheme synthase-like protein
VDALGGGSQGLVSALFPTFLKLAGRRVVVVGGGRMAVSKVEGLLRAGAQVTVVAPQVRAELERPEIQILRRPFRPEDLEEAWFAVAAATPEVNREVAESALRWRVFVNAVDDPQAASAYAGGVFERGGVTVAVSTSGAAPALAGLLREGLEALIPEDVESWVEVASALRAGWKRDGIPMDERRPLLLAALEELYASREARTHQAGDPAREPAGALP